MVAWAWRGGLNKRDKARPKHDKPRGLLGAKAARPAIGHERYWPTTALAPFVEHYWIVSWDLAEPHVAETVPHPSVHVVLESRASLVVGVMSRKFSRSLEGRGRVIGTKFKPGAFRPFCQGSVSALTDRRVVLSEVFGRSVAQLEERALAQVDDQGAIEVIEQYWLGFEAEPDPSLEFCGRVAARIAEDRGLTRVDQLVDEFHTPKRQLQRLFGEYVGVGPKWVIQRYRLLEAAERVVSGTVVDWADLALDLGYADQAHFIRDFKRLVGRSPRDYARGLERF